MSQTWKLESTNKLAISSISRELLVRISNTSGKKTILSLVPGLLGKLRIFFLILIR